ncbi:MAG: hypothetical protein ACLGHL_04385 [Actinomycetota bacterium]
MIRTEGRPWLPIAIGASALVAILVALGVIRAISDRPVSSGASGSTPEVVLDAEGEPLPQAPWKVNVYPTAIGKPGRSQRELVSKQRDDLKRLVRNLSDALLLDRDVSSVKRSLTPAVAQRLERSKLSVPEGMTEVRTLRRTAKVGVDEKATHAAARITIAYEGLLEGRTLKMQHKMDLWLQRNSDGWRVVAFSGTTGRAR